MEGKRNEYRVVRQSEYNVYEGIHEAIVDEATWEAAQERMAEESRPFPERRKGSHVHLLTGMLVCPVCGRSLIANVSQGKRKKDGTPGKATYAYTCKYSKKQFGPSCTFTRQYKQELIDREVVEIIKAASHSPVFARRVREELDSAVDTEKLKADVERIKKALANNKTARDMLSRQMDRVDAFDPNYERKYMDMQARLDDLYEEGGKTENALAEAEAKLDSAERNLVTTERVYQILNEFEAKFDQLDRERQREILRQVVEAVELNEGAEPKKGEIAVKSVRFKCPLSFGHELPESMKEQLGIEQFNWLEVTEYSTGDNSRVDENTVECVALLEKKS